MMYSKTVIELNMHPHNRGKMENPDGHGHVGSPICGDSMTIFLRVKNNEIVDAKFETMGCAAAISVGSMITDIVKGKTLKQADEITGNDVIEKLGGLPKEKMHCSNLVVSALQKALEDCKRKSESE